MVLMVAATALALLGAACSGSGNAAPTSPPTAAGPRPSSTGSVTILSPSNGQVFHGSSVNVPVKLELTGAKIVAATTTAIQPDEGHIHLYLDGQIVSMNFGLSADVSKVTAGQHILRAEFVASDHLPFNPRVITQVTFEVQS
jgi:hypothetical protein